jgi:putative transposase
MSRIARAVVEGYPHHVTQRGNCGQVVFHDAADRRFYLSCLSEYKERYGLEVWAWCLMDNHLHLVCVPKRRNSLSKTLHFAHVRYANYFNRRFGQEGHLWQGRFYSCALDRRYQAAAVKYVETNPVRAKAARRAENYRWSSARAHVSGKPDGVTDEKTPLEDLMQGKRVRWPAWLRVKMDEKEMDAIRSHTRTGRPLGSEGFVTRVEKKLRRKLRVLARGRPRKVVKKKARRGGRKHRA